MHGRVAGHVGDHTPRSELGPALWGPWGFFLSFATSLISFSNFSHPLFFSISSSFFFLLSSPNDLILLSSRCCTGQHHATCSTSIGVRPHSAVHFCTRQLAPTPPAVSRGGQQHHSHLSAAYTQHTGSKHAAHTQHTCTSARHPLRTLTLPYPAPLWLHKTQCTRSWVALALRPCHTQSWREPHTWDNTPAHGRWGTHALGVAGTRHAAPTLQLFVGLGRKGRQAY